jgi:thioredoxin-related protein
MRSHIAYPSLLVVRFRLRLLWLVLFWIAALSVVSARDFDDSELAHVAYPDWFKESFLDLRDDLADAEAEGKAGIMVLFTTEGCSYCAQFIRRTLGDEAIAARVRSRFDAIGLEMFSDAEMVGPGGEPMRVKELAEREGAGFSPTLLFFGTNGELRYRAIGYRDPERFGLVLDYLEGAYDRGQSFSDFLAEHARESETTRSSYRLAPDPLFGAPPYVLDRSRIAARQPLLVIFETDGCAGCAVFQGEVLALPRVRRLLAGFEIVRLDADDAETPVLAPDGTRTTPAAWYAASGLSHLPALLFFEENGREVLRTDALVLPQRMVNSLLFTRERAYEKQWTYQHFARSKALERRLPQPEQSGG